MNGQADIDAENIEIARRWCEAKGVGWSVHDQAGRGGTAPVFGIVSPDGDRALKIYDAKFSSGEKGEIEEQRVDQQIALGVHDCPYLIKVHQGGRFEDRLYLLMNRAPGRELMKRLGDVPRGKVRSIVGQIAIACIFLRSKGLCHRDIKSENVFISDDFNIATLLDISVLRGIHDPVGVGTDHDGQLPVVATARYSPPEYLFRLLDPGPELWHALDVYQLGGILHDLIMREPLFQAEYRRSIENRYRFAWTVATIDPAVHATDIDHDLVFIARRALDKKWERRSQLRLKDFLADVETQQSRALSALGLSSRGVVDAIPTNLTGMLRRVNDVASELETRILAYLRTQEVTAQHFLHPGDEDRSKRLVFTWKTPRAEADVDSGEVVFEIKLTFRDRPNGRTFECAAELKASINSNPQKVEISLPNVEDSESTTDRLMEHAVSALGNLAAKLMRSQTEE